jgi:ATP phosphoribosyltransferase
LKYNSIKDFNGKRIATSYPETTRNFLSQNGVEAELHIINGSVEIAPNIGLADAICDIVSSGSTLFKNNLKEVEIILKSEAVLAVSPNILEKQNSLLNKLKFRIESVLLGRDSRYVLLNAPNEKIEQIIKILPGWSSIHSVVNRDTFWEVIEELKEAGAEGILVCPIEKMIL